MGDAPPECFVPGCRKTVGVLFPKNRVTQREWLAALNLEHLVPDAKSFVCLDHFEDSGQPLFSEQTNLEVPNQKQKSLRTKSDSVEDSKEISSSKTPCRLCLTRVWDLPENIYSTLYQHYSIADAISVCLHPLKVAVDDDLPKCICPKCIEQLLVHLKFYEICMVNDMLQRKIANRSEPEDPADLGKKESKGLSERQNKDDNLLSGGEVIEYLHEERLSDYEDEKSENNDRSAEIGRVKKSSDQVGESKAKPKKRKYETSEELLKVLEGRDDLMEKSGPRSPECNKIVGKPLYSNLNDKKVVRPKADEEYIEQIIIEMVDDDGMPQKTAQCRSSPVKIVKKYRPAKKKTRRDFNMMQRCEEIVILPMAEVEYISPLGTFQCETVKYVFKSEFVLAGGYLYEYRLIKEDVRRLHCVLQRCPGAAYQSRAHRSDDFDQSLTVVTPHNHEVPDLLERKRQMFYNILFTKMSGDKHFNFKSLYDEFCRRDPSILTVLPLRNVVTEICREGPVRIPAPLTSFDDFYDLIESDDYYRVQFTDGREQFYQERFETDDGAKGVVFGNRTLIDWYSSSRLMFVDASFLLDCRDFPYQLVTVLVLVDDSYYPIVYAFINSKSQELYKKIFTYLYYDLAPNLRPKEIITDYEANLYYALGETYVDSGIGGSMFYFAQDIYKKICALGLAKELEYNLAFNNIYNILLVLPLLPVNTILDGLNNIETQANALNLREVTSELFAYVRDEWIGKVTPELFCVHRLENRINENIIAPFKKLRDLLTLTKTKKTRRLPASSIIISLEKIIDLERFLREVYNLPSKAPFTKDVSSSQKRLIVKAWDYIENFPVFELNQFFNKVMGYIKCLESQLWIWGYYCYKGTVPDILIDASNFSIINEQTVLEEAKTIIEERMSEEETENQEAIEDENITKYYIEEGGAIKIVEENGTSSIHQLNGVTDDTEGQESAVVMMEAVMDENGSYILQDRTQHG